MHFENALLEAFHYHPIAMWLLVTSVPVCLGAMWWSLTVCELRRTDR